MKKMTVIKIETVEIQGIKLVNVYFQSNRIVATSRAQSEDQYQIGQSFSGRLSYDAANKRVFSPIYKAA